MGSTEQASGPNQEVHSFSDLHSNGVGCGESMEPFHALALKEPRCCTLAHCAHCSRALCFEALGPYPQPCDYDCMHMHLGFRAAEQGSAALQHRGLRIRG